MKRRIKNPCPICGKPMDSQGWCGSSDHDAGNPWGGINCIAIGPDEKLEFVPSADVLDSERKE